jgi:hypothetical protein
MIQINITSYFVIIFVILLILSFGSTFRYYSGLQFILEKINPSEKGKLPTFTLWIIGIYIALFGVASNRYENRVDIIENRINGIYAQISKDIQIAFERLVDVQEMVCPVKPEILEPVSIVKSFLPLKDIRYEEGVEQLKQLVEDWAKRSETIESRLQREPQAEEWIKKLKGALKKDGTLDYKKRIGQLAGIDLRKAQFKEANLYQAQLEGAYLWEAQLEGAGLWRGKLERAGLRDANLERADLRLVKLEGANLRLAKLENACLCKADLKNAQYLTVGQLAKAFSLYGVKNLAPELEKEIKATKELQHLLEPNYKIWKCNDKGKGESFLSYIKKLKAD